jgi:methionine sulfoxide reductase heme-binding subunit
MDTPSAVVQRIPYVPLGLMTDPRHRERKFPFSRSEVRVTTLWYASRATGVVALLLLTGVMVLGMLVNRQGRLPGLPKFAVTGLHRNLSLLAVVFLAIHVLTAVVDGFVNIPLTSAVVPFTSPYERLWLSLGAVSLDLMLAAIVTSLLRRHLSRRAWRVVHLLSYLSWPVAWVHSFFASGDLRHGMLYVLALLCAIAVVVALMWRLVSAARDVPRAERVGLIMAAVHNRAPRGRDTARDTAAPRGARHSRDRTSTR